MHIKHIKWKQGSFFVALPHSASKSTACLGGVKSLLPGGALSGLQGFITATWLSQMLTKHLLCARPCAPSRNPSQVFQDRDQ